jgi:hypothetical protein
MKRFDREYRNFTVKERASLMIAARIRGDESECQNLIASADSKCYLERASEEAAICESWFNSHMLLILKNSEQRIVELQTEVVLARLDADNSFTTYLDEKLAEQVAELQIKIREEQKATLLAFNDWMNASDLQIDTMTLENYGLDHCEIAEPEKSELRSLAVYESFAKHLIATRFSY